MTVERVEFLGALFEVEFDDDRLPSQVGRVSGNYQTILWQYGELASVEVIGAIKIANGQRAERKSRNQS